MDWRQEYEQRTAGHRHPDEVFASIRELRSGVPGLPPDAVNAMLAEYAVEFVASMEAYQMVLYAP